MEKKLSTVGPAIRELAPPTHSTWATFLPARSAEAAGLARPKGPALIVAGDWNVLRGYGENGDEYWRARYDTVFEPGRGALLPFVGPVYPNGRQADPWPRDSLCVPTFHHSRQKPETATRQLDFVFASKALSDRVKVRALNTPAEWGPSDHCRLVIDVEPEDAFGNPAQEPGPDSNAEVH